MSVRIIVYGALAVAEAKVISEPELVKIAAQAADVARGTAPVDTGHFQASISSSGRLIINSDEAAAHIEFGTSDTIAHFTMVNAARQFGRYTGTS